MTHRFTPLLFWEFTPTRTNKDIGNTQDKVPQRPEKLVRQGKSSREGSDKKRVDARSPQAEYGILLLR